LETLTFRLGVVKFVYKSDSHSLLSFVSLIGFGAALQKSRKVLLDLHNNWTFGETLRFHRAAANHLYNPLRPSLRVLDKVHIISHCM